MVWIIQFRLTLDCGHRDRAQVLAHVHNAQIEIAKGRGRRRAMDQCNDRDLLRCFTLHPSRGRHHRAEAIECRDTGAAILRAEILSRIQGNVGAIAFSRTGDPKVGKFEDAVVLKRFGDVPNDMTMLF